MSVVFALMAYWFSGFFAKPSVEPPTTLPERAVWREIVSPFVGVGVLLAELQGERPSSEEVQSLVQRLGIDRADWIYLTYVCWAGSVDSVYGLGVCGGRPFGQVDEDRGTHTREAYIRLMGEFGVSPENAMRFPPFERGFWGG